MWEDKHKEKNFTDEAELAVCKDTAGGLQKPLNWEAGDSPAFLIC